MDYEYNGEQYTLNLIDTPGHVDFSYEVSRSIAACEGALLVVDAAQSIQAQTISNLYLALENDLEIIPVLNKIDLPSANPEEVTDDIVDLLGCRAEDVIPASAKTGLGIDTILDAVIKWKFYQNFELWAGQTKLPGNIERVISSGNLQLIDRSLLNSKFNIDRDIGVQLRHKSKLGGKWVSREKISISQGEGRNITQGNIGGLQYTARFELLPFGTFKSKGDYSQSDLVREKSIKTMLGITYDHNNNAVKTRSNMGSYMTQSNGGLFETDINTLFIDGIVKYNGFSLMGEYAKRKAGTIEALEQDGKTKTGSVVGVGSAINMQGSYLFNNNIEMTIRYTNIDFDNITRLSDLRQLTYGISKYVVGHKLKIQADLSFSKANENKDYVLFRTGFDLHF